MNNLRNKNITTKQMESVAEAFSMLSAHGRNESGQRRLAFEYLRLRELRDKGIIIAPMESDIGELTESKAERFFDVDYNE